MKPARIGTIKVKAAEPIDWTVAQMDPSGMTSPPGVFSPPIVSAMAISRPPMTMNGTM
ncbi:hypothetical protein D3C71_1505960 [compost metagenome]